MLYCTDCAVLHRTVLIMLYCTDPVLQQIQEDMEDGLDKKGDNKDFEEKLAEQLFADENTQKIQV